MITLKELNPKGYKLSAELSTNIQALLVAMNVIRAAYGKAMFITNGLRSIEDHKRIYMDIAKRLGVVSVRIPMGSKHLVAAACDVLDIDGSLYAWCMANDAILAKAGVFCELGTKGWVHFQIIPFGSYKPGGTRWFKP